MLHIPPTAPDVPASHHDNARVVRWSRLVCLGLGLYVAAVGLTSCLGWVLNLQRLTDWYNTGISIQPNATVCVLLSGLAVILLTAQRRRTARVLGAIVLAIAGATLFEWVSGLTLGIDEILMFGRTWGRVGVLFPGRMGPPGTVSWTLIGTALILSGGGPAARRLVPPLGLVVAAISGLSLVGYGYGAEQLFTLPRVTVIAMQTATCIFAVGVALVAGEPTREPMATLVSDSAAGAMARRLLPFSLLVPILLGRLLVVGLDAEAFDAKFGAAQRTIVEVALFTLLTWWSMSHVLRRERALRKNQEELAAALKEAADQRERFAVTLASIGDAVIATDPQARVTFMNHAAESLTGWKLAEAQGRPLAEVFKIVHEDTRTEAESPAVLALRDGRIVGLVNHTVLIAKDGAEWPIDDSAAPIRREGAIIGVVIVFHEISARRKAEARLHVSEIRFRRLFEAAHDGIIILDPKTRKITDANPFTLNLLALSRDEVIGKEPWEIGLFPDQATCEATMRALGERGVLRFENTLLRDHNGSLRPVEIVANLYEEERVKVAQFNIRDISDRIAFERERQALLANERALRMEADSANRAKDSFLATLSHEIRTPLNAIVGWTSILRRRKEGCTPENLREGLEVIERNARVQAQLIEDVMDVSRIVSGKLRLEMKLCDLSEAVQAGIDAVRPAADAKGIRLETQLECEAAMMLCDAARIQQVTWNLISNSVKFTPPGGSVTVRLAREAADVRLTVSDTGHGIAPDLLPHVFERYRQGDSSTRRKFGGMGLGLSIVKHLTELHGGSVQAHSAGEGKGASFTITLPIHAIGIHEETGDSGTTREAGGTEPPMRLDALRVLVVDDEPDARRALANVLQSAGAIVVAAASAAEAKSLLESVQPDVLVSDLGMPDEDGYDLIRAVRANGHTVAKLPAVALTAFAGIGYARSALLAGYQVHVPKPVDPHDLIVVVGSLVGRTSNAKSGAVE